MKDDLLRLMEELPPRAELEPELRRLMHHAITGRTHSRITLEHDGAPVVLEICNVTHNALSSALESERRRIERNRRLRGIGCHDGSHHDAIVDGVDNALCEAGLQISWHRGVAERHFSDRRCEQLTPEDLITFADSVRLARRKVPEGILLSPRVLVLRDGTRVPVVAAEIDLVTDTIAVPGEWEDYHDTTDTRAS